MAFGKMPADFMALQHPRRALNIVTIEIEPIERQDAGQWRWRTTVNLETEGYAGQWKTAYTRGGSICCALAEICRFTGDPRVMKWLTEIAN